MFLNKWYWVPATPFLQQNLTDQEPYLYHMLQDGHPEVAEVTVLNLELRMDEDENGGSD